MERRREARTQADEPIRLTVLSDDEDVALGARILDFSGRGVRVRLAHRIPIGAPVKLECSQQIWLGEVIYIRTDGDHFQAGIEIDQAFRDSRHLDQLRRAVEEGQASPIPLRTASD